MWSLSGSSADRGTAVRRWLLILAAALISGSSSIIGGITPAFASCPPNGAPGLNPPPPQPNARYASDYVWHYWDGWTRMLANTQAVNGNILVTDPWVDPPNNADASSAWVMIYDGGFNYAQVGWIKYASQQNSFFYTERNVGSSSYSRSTYNLLTPGATYPFMMQNQVRPGLIDYYAGGNLLRSGTSDFTANQAQEYGEIFTKSSEMPTWQGGEQFTSTSIYTAAGGWVNFAGTVSTTNGNFHGAGTDGQTHTWIWDWYCSY